MAKLSVKQRNAVPKSKMGLPGRKKSKTGSFPMPNKAHARAAEMLAPKSEAAGNITPMQKAMIDRRARRVLGSKGK